MKTTVASEYLFYIMLHIPYKIKCIWVLTGNKWMKLKLNNYIMIDIYWVENYFMNIEIRLATYVSQLRILWQINHKLHQSY